MTRIARINLDQNFQIRLDLLHLRDLRLISLTRDNSIFKRSLFRYHFSI